MGDAGGSQQRPERLPSLALSQFQLFPEETHPLLLTVQLDCGSQVLALKCQL